MLAPTRDLERGHQPVVAVEQPHGRADLEIELRHLLCKRTSDERFARGRPFRAGRCALSSDARLARGVSGSCFFVFKQISANMGPVVSCRMSKRLACQDLQTFRVCRPDGDRWLRAA